jgi:hypothetical protein
MDLNPYEATLWEDEDEGDPSKASAAGEGELLPWIIFFVSFILAGIMIVVVTLFSGASA